MRRVFACLLAFALSAPVAPLLAAGAGQSPSAGAISGQALTPSGTVMVNVTVRLREVATGQVSATATTTSTGAFTFPGLAPGSYVVEIVDAAGHVVATSTPIVLAAGATAAVTITGPAAAGGAASFFGSTLGLVTVAAAGAAVAGVTVAANRTTASPSR